LRIGIFACCAAISLLSFATTQAQQPTTPPVESPVPLNQAAQAFEANGQRGLEATLRTTALNGAPDTPVSNVRLVLKNVSPHFYEFVSGYVSFYDASGVRCGEGVFKADALTQNESVDIDSPGIRITCAASTWRIVASNLLPRGVQANVASQSSASPGNLMISIDGEEHPIQLGKPLVLNLGDKQRTVVVRTVP
jgi:hypothetical protein